MSDIFTIPKSNPINFVEIQDSKLINTINGRLTDINTNECYTENVYFQPISGDDNICFHFRTSRDISKLKIFFVNYSDLSEIDFSEIFANYIKKVYDYGTGVIDYKVIVPVFLSKYLLKIVSEDITYQSLTFISEWLECSYQYRNLALFTYSGNSNKDDGIIYDETTLSLRLDCDLKDITPNVTVSVYQGYDGKTVETESLSQLYYSLKVDQIPLYLCKILMLALEKDVIIINDQQIVPISACVFTQNGKTDLYNFSVVVTDAVFEDYSQEYKIINDVVNSGRYWVSNNSKKVVFQNNNNEIALIN